MFNSTRPPFRAWLRLTLYLPLVHTQERLATTLTSNFDPTGRCLLQVEMVDEDLESFTPSASSPLAIRHDFSRPRHLPASDFHFGYLVVVLRTSELLIVHASSRLRGLLHRDQIEENASQSSNQCQKLKQNSFTQISLHNVICTVGGKMCAL